MEREIREVFEDPKLADHPQEKARELAEKIEELGIEPFTPPPTLPHIQPEEIHLLCWLALVSPTEISPPPEPQPVHEQSDR